MKKKPFATVDQHVFWPSLLIILAIIVALTLFPTSSKSAIRFMFAFCTGQLGWAYLWIHVACFVFMFWLASSKYSRIKLGGQDAVKQYSEFSWAGMMFTSGIGTGILILGFMEPIYYLGAPPFNIAPLSPEAYEYAHMYGQYHWGISAWALYVPASVCVAYMIHNRGEKSLRISAACAPILPRRHAGKIKVLIDVLIIFGILGGIGTALGIGAPLLSHIVSQVLHVKDDLVVRLAILLFWLLLFGASVFRGLDKGIKMLSDFNVALAAVFVAFILFAGPTAFILKMETNSVGLMLERFARMSLWTDPIRNGGFPENWTIFYWGWWLAYMPMMGLFVARTSRGRTIRQVILGELIWGTLGCWLCFGVFGGYSLHLQQTGALDLNAILQSEGRNAGIMAILRSLPFSPVVIVIFVILSFVFLATTIDSSAYVLASVCTKTLSGNEQPPRWHRLLWAIVCMAVSVGLMLVDELSGGKTGSLEALQTASIVAGLPLIVVNVILMISSVRMFRNDKEVE